MKKKKKKDDADEQAQMFAGTEVAGSSGLTPFDIQQKEFRVSRMGGYRMRDVDEFLDEVTDALTSLISENERLRERGGVAPDAARGSSDVPAVHAAVTEDDARAVQAFLLQEREFLHSLGALVQGHVDGVREMARVARTPVAQAEAPVEEVGAEVTDGEATAAMPPVEAEEHVEPIRVEEPQPATSRRTDERTGGSLRELFWGED